MRLVRQCDVPCSSISLQLAALDSAGSGTGGASGLFPNDGATVVNRVGANITGAAFGFDLSRAWRGPFDYTKRLIWRSLAVSARRLGSLGWCLGLALTLWKLSMFCIGLGLFFRAGIEGAMFCLRLFLAFLVEGYLVARVLFSHGGLPLLTTAGAPAVRRTHSALQSSAFKRPEFFAVPMMHCVRDGSCRKQKETGGMVRSLGLASNHHRKARGIHR